MDNFKFKLGYLIAFYEGEGFVCITNRYGKAIPVVGVTQNHKKILEGIWKDFPQYFDRIKLIKKTGCWEILALKKMTLRRWKHELVPLFRTEKSKQEWKILYPLFFKKYDKRVHEAYETLFNLGYRKDVKGWHKWRNNISEGTKKALKKLKDEKKLQQIRNHKNLLEFC